ncbi:hypothetical protein PR048_021247 [Dryococelus australis]|uniref:Retrovirus-related Pol polyprotein from transposon TNT 1-94-like beta-barrel domain-containing protein n=1 Tax=Dryococelus australis TaxID=614101 RepID=A0ABQ9GXQ2_9NEOP|nr:hypothetical protein PR048_021247 [Dryococelus australis]
MRHGDKADRAASQALVKTLESNVMTLLVTCESARDMWISEKPKELVALLVAGHKIQSKSEQDSINIGHNKQSKKTGIVMAIRKTTSNVMVMDEKAIFDETVQNKRRNRMVVFRIVMAMIKVSEVMNAQLDDDLWIVDSGVTDHTTHNREWFSTFECFSSSIKIKIDDEFTMDALDKETIRLKLLAERKLLPCHIENSLYVPSARRNLFSKISALDKQMTCNSSRAKCRFIKECVVKTRPLCIG